ncbi:MAG: hypothetical protein M1840_006343 [Geoglossum simile]|nr:MAG: hypothetical protein M1840_006343 [Geoglossum simile]
MEFASEEKNKFLLQEIIFDPSLILSPHVFLLGLIFADRAFAAPNLTSAGQLSRLDIRPGYQQLELLLKPSMLDVPVFRKSSQSVDNHHRLRQLLEQRARWNRRFMGAATKQPGYGSLSSNIVNLRQRLRAALLKKLRDQWDIENPVNEVELQLSGLKFNDNPGTKVQVVDDDHARYDGGGGVSPAQRCDQ